MKSHVLAGAFLYRCSVFVLLMILTALSLFAAGPTLKTITVDGVATDWAPILSNPLQVTNDGEFSPQCNVPPLDRDCTNNTNISGRDLNRFAWTYDGSNIYMYVSRYGSSTNTQTYYFYCDTSRNKRMNDGEKVFQVVLNGSNRNTEAYLFTYNAVDDTNGDSLVDASGYADGYTLPGTLYTKAPYPPVTIYTNTIGGFADGRGFECRLPWTNLGVPAGTPVYFHVSSSNNSNGGTVPAQIDDNLGGPDGGIGSFAFYLVDLYDNESQTVAPGNPATITYYHTCKNTGTLDDEYNFEISSSLALPADLYDDGTNTLMASDTDGDGDWDYVNPVYNSDSGTGDTRPDTPILTTASPGNTFSLRLELTAAAGITDVIDTTILTAISLTEPLDSYDSVTDITGIGQVTLQPSLQTGAAAVGQYAEYTLTLTNNGLDDVFDLYVLSSLGYRLQIYTGGGALVAEDTNGDGSFESIQSGYDTNSNGYPDFGTVFNGTPVTFRVRVYSGTLNDVDVTSVTAVGDIYGTSDDAQLTTTIRSRLTLTPSYLFSNNTNKFSGDSRSVFFAHTLINSWITSETITLSQTSTQGWTVRYYTDPDGDGNPSDGNQITGTFSLPAYGGEMDLVVEIIVPDLAPTSYPVQNSTTVTATSGTGATAAVTDQLTVSYIAAYADPNRTISQTFFARCDTVYLQGASLTLSTTTTYRIDIFPPSSSTAIQSHTVPTDGSGDALDEYTFTSTDTLGTWTVRLYQSGTLLDTILITLDPAATPSTIGPITTNRASYSLTGNNLTVTATFNNTSTGAVYYDTTYRYRVINPDGTQYLTSSGTFSSYDSALFTRITLPHTIAAGDSATETVSVNNVSFPVEGIYTIQVYWLGSCDNTIATATFPIPVGTALASYADASWTDPEDYFTLADTIYLYGSPLLPTTSYTVVYYDEDGTLVLTQTVITNGSGELSTSVDGSSLGSEGTWHAVIYPTGAPIPPLYSPTDPDAAAMDDFVLEPDTDGDGIADTPDLDADNDGIADAVEGTGDADGDGIPNYLDLDSDGDGVWDLIEGNDANFDGVTDYAVTDADNDGRIDTITDADGDGWDDHYDPSEGGTPAVTQNFDGDTLPDYLDPDDDGDSIPTADEDANGNGDPTDDDTNSNGNPNYLDLDSDSDGIPDATEHTGDTADGGDGLGNYIDDDSDGDGIPDSIEGTGDIDGDGIPNFLDPDSDGDGIPDSVEDSGTGTDDYDGDGIPNYLDLDSDADGLPDQIEGTADSDTDGSPDFLDPDVPTDSDGDGISDVTEGSGDSDGDGVADYLDLDSDNDGIPDAAEGAGDFDGDGIPNYLDLDSDGDGVWDLIEGNDADQDGANDNTGVTDADNDGRIDTITDANGNGLDDTYETTPAALQDSDNDGNPDFLDTDDDNDGIPTANEYDRFGGDTSPIGDDTDSDGIPNYLDPDSDDDGIPDRIEGTGDGDGDTQPDFLDPDALTDSDNDGIPDVTENSAPLDDQDGDGIPNDQDLDSDGDGIYDSDEGAGDTDGDGIPDYLDLDSDNDGIPDSVEGGDGNPDTPPVDTDGDGIPDFRDPDSDDDGISDGQEGLGDPDGDGIPNYLDLDSDGDTISDEDESFGDFDGDGVPNYLDLDCDNDGIPDADEAGDSDLGTKPVDTDGDGSPDFQDLDADGDGVEDLIEGNDADHDGVNDNTTVVDSNGDGQIDTITDTNGNGLDDSYETTPATLQDTDTDGKPDFQDVDDDGDGYDTSEEDTNGNGDWSDDDQDNDGIPDYLDPDSGPIPIPDLLRNDEIASTNPLSTALNAIFVQTHPADPALDPSGANMVADEGEGSMMEANGSEDDDDFYAADITSPYVDPDPTVLTDNGRPLVFYELVGNCTIYLNKYNDGGTWKIQVTFTCN
ncbi:MAG TPA: hypothetical protein PK014_02890 [Thermoanaerobaculia bacterium]|nr:hypothetical protein [Thermoanaerobaculia bacterium]HUM29003.1 hypothetical protein [Thermoanaerobaculia bacterium]HXK67441.1 hypothetical protein [Thermoanaerobaculia bacterium]